MKSEERNDSVDRHLHVDRLCMEFEQKWQAGEQPKIEDYLQRVPDASRLLLLEELLLIERELKNRSQQVCSLAEYLERFPNDSSIVQKVIGRSDEETNHELVDTKPQVQRQSTKDDGSAAANLAPTETWAADETFKTHAGVRQKIFGDYELIEEIARGGMGVVYKARQMKLNRIVALKMILSGQFAGSEEVQRFQAEAEAAAHLNHPGIVPIFEIGEQSGQHYFSMGFVEGRSLAHRLRDGPLSPREAAQVTKTISQAVAYAHDKGVIHRDLKPGNVLIDATGEPKVTDFGLAKQVEVDSGLTKTGAVMGTPSYMPPEQAAGKAAEVGPAADVYSLGAILYCLLTGRPPFQAATSFETLMQVIGREPVAPRTINPSLPRDLETICLRCLQKDRRNRYESADELVAELQRYLNGEPIKARRISAAERTWRWCKRKPVIAGSATAISLLLLLVALSSVRTSRFADLSASLSEFQTEIKKEQFSADHLQRLDALASKIALLDATESEKAKHAIDTTFAAAIEKEILRSNLNEDAITRIEELLGLINARSESDATRLRELLAGRMRRWQTTLDLKPPFDDVENFFVDSDVQITQDQKGLLLSRGIARTTVPSRGNVQLRVLYQIDRARPSQLGLLFQPEEASGYEIQLEVIPATNTTEDANDTHDENMVSADLRILKSGKIVRSQRTDGLPVDEDSLELIAQREATRLSLIVKGRPPFVFDDIFPLVTSIDETFAIRSDGKTHVARVTASRQLAPPTPTPLERGDQLFSAGQYIDALQHFEAQLSISKGIEIRSEARFKQALCLLRTDRRSEALQILEELIPTKTTRWSIVAAAQAWEIYLQQKKFDEADTVFQLLLFENDARSIAPLISQSVRDTILNAYLSHLRISYDLADKNEMARRVEQLERIARISQLIGASLKREHELFWHVARGFESIGLPDQAIRLIEEQLSRLEDAPEGERDAAIRDYCTTYSRIVRLADDPQKAIDKIDHWLPKVTTNSILTQIKLLRVNVLIAQNRWDEARQQIKIIREDYTKTRAVDTSKIVGAEVLGLIEQHLGNEAEALKIWREAFETMRKLGKTRLAASRRAAWSLLILGVWSQSITDDEIDSILASLTSVYGKLNEGEQGTLFNSITASRIPVPPSVVRAAIENQRGKSFSESFILDRIRLDQRYVVPFQLLACEFIVNGTAGRAAVPDVFDEICWNLAGDLIQSYQTRELDSSLFMFLFGAWKGQSGLLGWQTVANLLQDKPELRAPLAYLTAHRLIRLAKSDEARPVLEMVIDDAGDGSALAKMADEDLGFLADNKRLVSFRNETESIVEVNLVTAGKKVKSISAKPFSETKIVVDAQNYQVRLANDPLVVTTVDKVSSSQRLRQNVIIKAKEIAESPPIETSGDYALEFLDERDFVEIAEWILQIDGKEAKYSDVPRLLIWDGDKAREVRDRVGLPNGPFDVVGIDLQDSGLVNDRSLERMTGLTRLTRLSLKNTLITNEGLKFLSGLPSLESVDLSATDVSEVGLEILTSLPNLQTLVLANTRISGLRQVKGHSKLRNLDLAAANVTDQGIGVLSSLPALERLNLERTQISDIGLKRLTGCRKLRQLYISGTSITASGVASFKQAVPKCEVHYDPDQAWTAKDREVARWVLEMGGRRWKTLQQSTLVILNGTRKSINEIEELPDGPFSIRTIHVSGNKKIDDASLSRFAELRSLETLSLQDTSVTSTGLGNLKTARSLRSLSIRLNDDELQAVLQLPNLQHLGMAKSAVTDRGLHVIGSLRKLKSLDLSETQVSDQGIEQLAKHTGLRRLILDNTAITDAILPHVKSLRNLEHLDIRETKVTAEGVAKIKEALPDCEVVWQQKMPQLNGQD